MSDKDGCCFFFPADYRFFTPHRPTLNIGKVTFYIGSVIIILIELRQV